MSKKRKSLQVKYRDLTLDLRSQVNFTYGHIQKDQNPTVKHIIKKLKKHEKIYIEEEAHVTAQENREAIQLAKLRKTRDDTICPAFFSFGLTFFHSFR